MNKQHKYLGDGLYGYHDGFQFVLYTMRDGDKHFIALDPEVLYSFFDLIEKTCNVKITATKEADHENVPEIE